MKLLNLKIGNKKLIIIIFPIIMSTISMTMITQKLFTSFAYIITLFIYIVTFKIIFEETMHVIYNISITCIFQLILNRDIVIGIMAILCNQSMYKTIQSYESYLLSFALCRIVMLILSINFNNVCNIKEAKKLLINIKKLNTITLTTTGLAIILLNSNYTYYYSGSTTSPIVMLTNRICIGYCFYCALKMGMKSIKWVEDEVLYRAKILTVDHNKSMNKKRDEYSKLLKMYNHDFKSILNNVKSLLNMGDIEKAKKIILEFDDQVQNVMEDNKEFSNNVLVNAILNRLSEECDTKNINFEAECYIPEEIKLPELELIRIFNNLSSNAFEACIKQDKFENKWINFRSYVKEDSLIIYQINSFNGQIKMVNDKLISTKENGKLNGVGVESIRHIVEEANGIALIKVEKDKKEFKFLIKIPITIK